MLRWNSSLLLAAPSYIHQQNTKKGSKVSYDDSRHNSHYRTLPSLVWAGGGVWAEARRPVCQEKRREKYLERCRNVDWEILSNVTTFTTITQLTTAHKKKRAKRHCRCNFVTQKRVSGMWTLSAWTRSERNWYRESMELLKFPYSDSCTVHYARAILR